ncbi:phosphodiesterase/alkaline phosphatase D-like protein [Paraburkholderia sp. GAS199]|uniref:hypothetical protein n=1 Tax=Paraburkholderia sp. GAS199 TaxID=3035126 RepID=UPI003D1AC06F
MINRRFFLRASALSLAGIASHAAKAAPATPQHIIVARHGYTLTNGVTALKRDDGAWIFWVRLINFDDPKSDISGSLQIATDRAFTQIVDRVPLTFSQSKSFIAQPVYQPKNGNVQLFYRCVVGSGPSVAPSVSSVVNSISPWNQESKAE